MGDVTTAIGAVVEAADGTSGTGVEEGSEAGVTTATSVDGITATAEESATAGVEVAEAPVAALLVVTLGLVPEETPSQTAGPGMV